MKRTAAGLSLIIAVALVMGTVAPAFHPAWAQTAPLASDPEFQEILNRLRTLTAEQDSLSALAESGGEELHRVRQAQIWERQTLVETALLALAENLHRQEASGRELAPSRQAVSEMVRRGWPRYEAFLRGLRKEFEALRRDRDAASGAQRLSIESRMSELSERQATQYRSLVDVIVKLEGVGIDVSNAHQFVVTQLTALSDVLVTQLRVLDRERTSTAEQVARAPADQGLRHELLAIEERRDRTSDNLRLAAELLGKFDIDTSRFKVALIMSTGKITADVFDHKVLSGLLAVGQKRVLEFIAKEAPRWLFHGLIIVLILLGFRVLSKVIRRAVRGAMKSANVSYLLRETIIAGSSRVVMAIGVIVALTQLGVHVGTLFAGIGVAGVVIGFAMQNTISNFASGALILIYRPFDVGDVVEVGGAIGTVKAMNLVATTILSFDNQTLIVPNSKIWGDVIRNTTAQTTRRVDLTFSVGYRDDLERAESVLRDIVLANDKVLQDPPAVIKVDQLADGGVNIVVRPWTLKENYWDVYWEITRAVKLRFDLEAISIPGARRDLYLHTVTARAAEGDGAPSPVPAPEAAAEPKPPSPAAKS